jgi:hypothetical protein
MRTHPTTFALVCTLCLALGACSNDESTTPATTPVDGGAPSLPAPATDAGATAAVPPTDGAVAPISKAIPLVDWVDDLVDHHTDDTSPPDTVDDKNIADNEDPTTFDRRF